MVAAVARNYPDLDLPASPDGRALTDVLATVAQEVTDLSSLADRLQGLIRSTIIDDQAAAARHHQEVQSIDLLIQRLQGVAMFVEGLGEAISPSWRVDVEPSSAQLLLQDQANRFAGRSHNDPAAHCDRMASGDIEFFE